MSDADISGLKGVGKTIVSKIRELQESGKLGTMEKYKALTPPGVQEMLQIKGKCRRHYKQWEDPIISKEMHLISLTFNIIVTILSTNIRILEMSVRE